MLDIMDRNHGDYAVCDSAVKSTKVHSGDTSDSKHPLKNSTITQFFKSPPKEIQKPGNLLGYFKKSSPEIVAEKSSKSVQPKTNCPKSEQEKTEEIKGKLQKLKEKSSSSSIIKSEDEQRLDDVDQDFVTVNKSVRNVGSKKRSSKKGQERSSNSKEDAKVKSCKVAIVTLGEDIDDKVKGHGAIKEEVKSDKPRKKDTSGKRKRDVKPKSKESLSGEDAQEPSLTKRKKGDVINSSSEDFESSVKSNKPKVSKSGGKEKKVSEKRKKKEEVSGGDTKKVVEVVESKDGNSGEILSQSKCGNQSERKEDGNLDQCEVISYADFLNSSFETGKTDASAGESEMVARVDVKDDATIISFKDYCKEQDSEEEDEVLLLSMGKSSDGEDSDEDEVLKKGEELMEEDEDNERRKVGSEDSPKAYDKASSVDDADEIESTIDEMKSDVSTLDKDISDSSLSTMAEDVMSEQKKPDDKKCATLTKDCSALGRGEPKSSAEEEPSFNPVLISVISEDIADVTSERGKSGAADKETSVDAKRAAEGDKEVASQASETREGKEEKVSSDLVKEDGDKKDDVVEAEKVDKTTDVTVDTKGKPALEDTDRESSSTTTTFKKVTVEAQIHSPQGKSDVEEVCIIDNDTIVGRTSNVAVKGDDVDLSITEVITTPKKPLYSIFMKKPKGDKKKKEEGDGSKVDCDKKEEKKPDLKEEEMGDATLDCPQKMVEIKDEVEPKKGKSVGNNKAGKQNAKQKKGIPESKEVKTIKEGVEGKEVKMVKKRVKRRLISEDGNDGDDERMDIDGEVTKRDDGEGAAKSDGVPKPGVPTPETAAPPTSEEGGGLRRTLRIRKPVRRLIISSDEDEFEEEVTDSTKKKKKTGAAKSRVAVEKGVSDIFGQKNAKMAKVQQALQKAKTKKIDAPPKSSTPKQTSKKVTKSRVTVDLSDIRAEVSTIKKGTLNCKSNRSSEKCGKEKASETKVKSKASVKLAPMFTKEGRKAIAKKQEELDQIAIIDMTHDSDNEEGNFQELTASPFKSITWKEKNRAETALIPPFPRVSHIQQIDEPSVNGPDFWRLPFPEQLEMRFRSSFASQTDFCQIFQETIMPGQFTSSQILCLPFPKFEFQKYPELSGETHRLVLEEIAKHSPKFPVKRVFKRYLAKRKGEKTDDQTKETSNHRTQNNKEGSGKSLKRKNPVPGNEPCKIRRRSLRIKSPKGAGDATSENETEVEILDVKEEKTEKEPKDILWTDKYQPMSSSEVLGNGISVKKLNGWLGEWKTRIQKLKKKEAKASKKTKQSDADSESDFEMSDEDLSGSEEEDDRLCNTMLITGPTGVGKTSMVYACAKELGFKVLEVNASSKRVGKQILMDLGEATQSHRVADQPGANSLTKFFTVNNMPGRLKSPPKAPPKPKKIPKAFAAFYKAGANSKDDGTAKKLTPKKTPLKTKSNQKVAQTKSNQKVTQNKSQTQLKSAKKSGAKDLKSVLLAKTDSTLQSKGNKTPIRKTGQSISTTSGKKPTGVPTGKGTGRGKGRTQQPLKTLGKKGSAKIVGKELANIVGKKSDKAGTAKGNENKLKLRKESRTLPVKKIVKKSPVKVNPKVSVNKFSLKKNGEKAGIRSSPKKGLKDTGRKHSMDDAVSGVKQKILSYSLILFDEADVVFEEDKGFWSAIATFMSSTKRPIILTTSDKRFQDTLEGKYEMLSLKKPDSSRIATSMQLLCLAENVYTDYQDMKNVAEHFDRDLRQCITNVQFWINSGATLSVIGGQTNHENTSSDDKVSLKPAPEKKMDVKMTNCAVDADCDNKSYDTTADVVIIDLENPENVEQNKMVTDQSNISKDSDDHSKKLPTMHQGCLESILCLTNRCGCINSTSSMFKSETISSMDFHRLQSVLGGLSSNNLKVCETLEDDIVQSELDTILTRNEIEHDTKEEKVFNSRLIGSIHEYSETLCYLDVYSTKRNMNIHGHCNHQQGWWSSSTYPSLAEETNDVAPVNFCSENEVYELTNFVRCGNLRRCSSEIQRISKESSCGLNPMETAECAMTVVKCNSEMDDAQNILNSRLLLKVNAPNNEINDLYELIARKLPRAVRCNHWVVTTNYLPMLRGVCRTEQLREESKIKRRFLHYLDSISFNIRPADQLLLASITDHLSKRTPRPMISDETTDADRADEFNSSFLTC